MPPLSSFLAAIRAHPEDDTPRLVFSDWLEENEQPERAEFIRAQIELARLRQDSPRRRELAFRARQLLDQREETWTGPLLDPFYCEGQFRRGFIDTIGLNADALEESLEELFDAYPLCRLSIRGLDGDLDSLRRIPASNTLTDLNLTGNDLDAAALKELAGFKHLKRLQTLSLLFNRIDDEGAQLLCKRKFFQRLALIRCGANPLSAGARQRLVDHFGERISFRCEREDDYLYAINEPDRFTTGYGRGHTQIFMLVGESRLRTAFFDHLGNLLELQQRDISQEMVNDWREREANREKAREAWLKELEFRPGKIKVKRFQFEEGLGIYDFAEGWTETFQTPDDPEIETARDWIYCWLWSGKFAFRFKGDDWWLERNGLVTDT